MERQRVFQPPVENKKSSSVDIGRTAGSSAHEREGGSDEVDVAAIKKKVSKALKKVCCSHCLLLMVVILCLKFQKR